MKLRCQLLDPPHVRGEHHHHHPAGGTALLAQDEVVLQLGDLAAGAVLSGGTQRDLLQARVAVRADLALLHARLLPGLF